MKGYILLGYLETGEAIYRCPDNTLAIEKDYRHLVNPTKEEMEKIYDKFAI